MVNKLFTFEESVPVNDNFQAMGYESTNLLQTLDTILIFLVVIIMSMVTTLIVDFVLRGKPL
jgi:hypothetical protein